MNKSAIKEQLMDYMSNLTIIDTHEHFALEKYHMTNDYNFFHLFMPYIQFDLYSAGMPKEWLWQIPQSEQEVDKYWKVISPLWKYVKHGSYERPLLMAMKKFWGVDDITDDNYKEIGRIMNSTRREGYYKEVLSDECHIKYILNQVGLAKCDEYDYMKGSFSVANYHYHPAVREFLKDNSTATVDDYIEYINKEMDKAENEGAVLSKFTTAAFVKQPDRDKAHEEFERFKKHPAYTSCSDMQAYISDEVLKHMHDKELIAAFHCGVWGNINEQDPKLLYPVVERHEDVTFDIYHMGMPSVRECGFLGKNYQNVYLNLCWSHIVSSEMATNALREWLDFIPTNKIFGFGGDYATNPENIWAHLMIARQNFAQVFSEKIEKGFMDLDSAKEIIKMWLYDNPARVYRLDD